MREYDRNRRRPDVVAQPAMVTTGAVRTHLLELLAAGVSRHQIGRLAAVDGKIVRRIIGGEQRRIRPATRDRLLGVFPSETLTVPFPHADLEALRRRGLSIREIGRRVAGDPDAVRPRAATMRRGLAEAVHDLAVALGAVKDAAVVGSLGVDPISGLALLLRERESLAWRADAACRTVTVTGGRSPWFPTRGEPARPALDVCDRCVSWAECLNFALDHDEIGIWGRTTEQARRALKRVGVRAEDVDGDPAGYLAGRDLEEATA